MSRILITGGAGFIGFHLLKMLSNKHEVLGIDDFNSFLYDSRHKYARKTELSRYGITVKNVDIQDFDSLDNSIQEFEPEIIIHLAAHAGVRHSMNHAVEYVENNVIGTQNLINLCEKHGIEKVIYASTSCVMAGNELPWKEDVPTFHQLNPYGYTKRTNECQFQMSSIKKKIGLRFFTVYGPWGRPDMALFKFTNGIVNETPIQLFNNGLMKRDFTYIDDIIQGLDIIVNKIQNSNEEFIGEIYNIGNGKQVNLMDYVRALENEFGKKAIIELKPKHPADTTETWSDTSKIRELGYDPKTPVEEGIHFFAEWYKQR